MARESHVFGHLVFVGPKGVGKTAIVQQCYGPGYTGQTGLPDVNIYSKAFAIVDRRINVKVPDFAADQFTQQSVSEFCGQATALVLVIDFEDIMNEKLDERYAAILDNIKSWMQTGKENKAFRIIINKIDLAEQEKYATKAKSRSVAQQVHSAALTKDRLRPKVQGWLSSRECNDALQKCKIYFNSCQREGLNAAQRNFEAIRVERMHAEIVSSVAIEHYPLTPEQQLKRLESADDIINMLKQDLEDIAHTDNESAQYTKQTKLHELAQIIQSFDENKQRDYWNLYAVYQALQQALSDQDAALVGITTGRRWPHYGLGRTATYEAMSDMLARYIVQREVATICQEGVDYSTDRQSQLQSLISNYHGRYGHGFRLFTSPAKKLLQAQLRGISDQQQHQQVHNVFLA